MRNALTEIFTGLKSLFIGMRITIGEFFKPTVTIRYPHQTLKMPARFRGHIELVSDPETGKPKCFVCKLCEKACPSDCITVDGVKPEGARRKTVTTYRLDFTKCSLCGSCVEACRDGAIRFSRDYNLAALNKEEFIMDLFKRLESEGAGLPAADASQSADQVLANAPGPSAASAAANPGAVLAQASAPVLPAVSCESNLKPVAPEALKVEVK